MFTHSTARYFARQAYTLRLMTGKEHTRLGEYTIDWQVPGYIAITNSNDTTRLVKIAKAWTNL